MTIVLASRILYLIAIQFSELFLFFKSNLLVFIGVSSVQLQIGVDT